MSMAGHLTYAAQANISVDSEVQPNPYAEVTVGFDIELPNGLVNLSARVEAKPKIVNAFWSTVILIFDLRLVFSITEGTGVCVNGLWFESIFDFSVVAFVGSFWSATLYDD